jgi:UDP-N-acetylmuramate dehydrogenase
MDDILKYLQTILAEKSILKDEPLHNYTFTKLGGNADYLVFPISNEQVKKIFDYTQLHHIPLTILGHGANVIIKDGGIRGIVMSLLKMKTIHLKGNNISAQGGAPLIDVSKFALTQQLSGLEFACGIPGSVGGALYMNAGAYDGQISDVLIGATVLNQKGVIQYLEKEHLQADYRTSTIAKEKYIVLEAIFQLAIGNGHDIQTKMADLTFQRESKQPLEYPSCGSVFKRPPGYFAGKLIQECNLQGTRIGGAEISKKHAGFIINVNHATASDYIELIRFTQKTVKEAFGVDLETEVKIIGED